MIDALYSCWAFNNVDFAADLQYSASIDFLQNIFKVHRTIRFSPQDMGLCWIMLNPHSLDAIMELLSIFRMPSFFFFFFNNHFTLLDPWKYFNFVGTKELFHFTRIRKLFHQGTTRIYIYILLESRISYGIKGLLSFARIKDLLNFTFLESRIS